MAEKIRVSSPVLRYLDGSQLFQEPDALDAHGYGEGGRRLVQLIRAAKPRKDGSVMITLDSLDVAHPLYDYADVMADSAADDAREAFRDPYFAGTALAELNAGRALVRKLADRFCVRVHLDPLCRCYADDGYLMPSQVGKHTCGPGRCRECGR